MQFGVGMNSLSNTVNAWNRYFGWDDDQSTLYSDILQSINIAGAATGALSCSKLLFMPRLRVMLILNVVLCVGVGISLIG